MAQKLIKFSPVFLLLAAIPSCVYQPVLNLKDVPLPAMANGSKYTKAQVQKAIMEGCRERGWVAQVKEKGVIEASIVARLHRATIEIQYDESQISILYRDSSNLYYSDGTIHPNYNRWVEYLYRTILSKLPSN